ncbi:MAG: hypothetical protein K8F25_16605, partial [Fimbriimonadaceae bacterium]|nr:hypothetical protein [Alphaproteobacteria bacterium]
MRFSLIISGIAHIAVLVWTTLVFPSPEIFMVEPMRTLPVDIVSASEMTRIMAGEKDAEPPTPEEPAKAPPKEERPAIPQQQAALPPSPAEPTPKPSPPPTPPERTSAPEPVPEPVAEPAPRP